MSRAGRAVVGASSSINGVVAGGVAALACVVGYLHVYLPHYSAASDVARERARAGADAAAVAGGPKKGSTWAAVTKAREAH